MAWYRAYNSGENKGTCIDNSQEWSTDNLNRTQEDWSKSKIKDTLCSQAACFVTKIRDDALMNELKRQWNNTEFWCTMDEEEPHICHIHLRTIIDTQITMVVT